jgi:hypothetical protein
MIFSLIGTNINQCHYEADQMATSFLLEVFQKAEGAPANSRCLSRCVQSLKQNQREHFSADECLAEIQTGVPEAVILSGG